MNRESDEGQEIGNSSEVEEKAESDDEEHRSGDSESEWQSNILNEATEMAMYSVWDWMFKEV